VGKLVEVVKLVKLVGLGSFPGEYEIFEYTMSIG